MLNPLSGSGSVSALLLETAEDDSGTCDAGLELLLEIAVDATLLRLELFEYTEETAPEELFVCVFPLTLLDMADEKSEVSDTLLPDDVCDAVLETLLCGL